MQYQRLESQPSVTSGLLIDNDVAILNDSIKNIVIECAAGVNAFMKI